MGLIRPLTKDNLWFPALFFRAMNLFDGIERPDEEEIYRRFRLFDEVTAAEYLGSPILFWNRIRCFVYAAARCDFHRWRVIQQNRLLHQLCRFRHWRRKSVSRYVAWGFKEPIAQVFLPQLIEHYPDLRYILVVRQPLAMASSSNQWQQRLWGPIFGIEGDSISTSLEYWHRANQRNLDLMRRLGDRGFVLRYEDLCEHPRDVIEQLRRFVSAPRVTADLAMMVQPSTRDVQRHRLDLAADALERAESLFDSLVTGPLSEVEG